MFFSSVELSEFQMQAWMGKVIVTCFCILMASELLTIIWELSPSTHISRFISLVSLPLPWWLKPYSICLQCRRPGFNSWVRKISWRRKWHPTPVAVPGKSHGRRSLVGYSPWGHKESDTTERLHFPFSLSCIGKGNGNPLQCSCLENPRDGGAWWAAVSGVAQSWTWLKQLSSSSSSVWRFQFSLTCW